VENTPENLARRIPDASSLKPGVLMPAIPISHSDLEAVVAYLESLE
jgi:cytochrome c1